ncbi:MAG: hypothetical protein LBM92_03275, partial [Opitutaceae bacterium]|nr:hypothetical protein [Opitutaceae bacterium]
MTHHPSPRFAFAASSAVFAIFRRLPAPALAALVLTLAAPAPVRAQSNPIVIELPASGTYTTVLIGSAGAPYVYLWAHDGTAVIQGTRTSSGGAVYFSAANSVFTATASQPGGVVLFQGATINTGQYGGAIDMAGLDSILNVSGVHFRDNLAQGTTGWGGAILAGARAVVTASQALFENNTAGRGGAIVLSGGTIQLWAGGATFNQNRSDYGGAIYTPSAIGNYLNLDGAELHGNIANIQGGALYIGGTLSAEGAIFEGNHTNATSTASNSGGAIALVSSADNFTALFLAGATFDSNTAGLGGAISIASYANAPKTIDIRGATFTQNVAGYSTGGAISAIS